MHSVAASGINLMKASMDEKLNLVMTLKASIDRARYIIDNANLYCFLVTDCGWKPDYIWEILNSNVKNEIAERVINKWNQGYVRLELCYCACSACQFQVQSLLPMPKA